MYFDFNNIRERSTSVIQEAIEAIDGYFFVFKDNPREVYTEIRLSEQPGAPTFKIAVRWNPDLDDWPLNLPWQISNQDVHVEVFLYGRDLELSLKDKVTDSISNIFFQIGDEGPSGGFLDKESYSHGLVTVSLDKIVSKDDNLLVTRKKFYLFVMEMGGLLFRGSLGPRELGCHLRTTRNYTRKVFLLFTPLD